jgi:hypothetical protein
MCPFVPSTVARRPGDGDRDAAVALLEPINPQVVVAFLLAPLDR